MRTKRVLTRTALPLLIGIGLVAVALWLFGAMPVRGAINSAPIESPEAATAPQLPVQAQAPITIPLGTPPAKLDGFCTQTNTVTLLIIPSLISAAFKAKCT